MSPNAPGPSSQTPQDPAWGPNRGPEWRRDRDGGAIPPPGPRSDRSWGDGEHGAGSDAHGWGAPDAPSATDAEFEVTPDGRLRRRIVSDREKWISIGIHLWWVLLVTPISVLAAGLPIGLWLWQKNQNEFLDDQGREAINFGISVLIISALLTVSIVGVLLLIPYWVIALISAVRAAIASTKGEYFRYPLTFRMV